MGYHLNNEKHIRHFRWKQQPTSGRAGKKFTTPKTGLGVEEGSSGDGKTPLWSEHLGALTRVPWERSALPAAGSSAYGKGTTAVTS